MKKLNFIYLSIVILFFIISPKAIAQKKIKIDRNKLMESYLYLKEQEFKDTLTKSYNFLSDWHFERAYAKDFVDDLISVTNKIDLPFKEDLLDKLRIIKCHNTTEVFDFWYIILVSKNGDYYYYSYENNSGIKKIPLIGTTKNEDFIWETANLILQIRAEKNEDYMLCVEVKNNSISFIDASQTFHISDNAILSRMLRFIKMKRGE